jgi:hypothetical protein
LVTLRSAIVTPRSRKIAWISGTLRCSRWRNAPTSAITSKPNSCCGKATAPSASGRQGV